MKVALYLLPVHKGGRFRAPSVFTPGTNLIRCWVRNRAGTDAFKRNIFASAGNGTPIPRSPIRSFVTVANNAGGSAGQYKTLMAVHNTASRAGIYAHPILKVTGVMNHYMTRDHQLVYNQRLKMYEK